MYSTTHKKTQCTYLQENGLSTHKCSIVVQGGPCNFMCKCSNAIIALLKHRWRDSVSAETWSLTTMEPREDHIHPHNIQMFNYDKNVALFAKQLGIPELYVGDTCTINLLRRLHSISKRLYCDSSFDA